MSHPTASSSEPFPQSPMRFGLGAFLVLATVVSVVVGLWFLSASRQKAFVAAVQARGGAVFYDFQHDSDGPFDPSLNPPALARWLGVDAVARIETVILDARKVDDAFLDILAEGPQVPEYVVVHYLFEPPSVEEKLAELFPDATIGTIHSYDGGMPARAAPLR